MSLSHLLLIGLSGLSWSLLDTSRKKLAENLGPIPVVVWLMILQTPVFAAMAATEAWVIPPSGYWLPAVASIVLNTIANVCFVNAITLAPLSLAIPVLSLGPVFSALGAFLVLGEATTLRQATGIVIIVATIFGLGITGTRQAASAQGSSNVRVGLLLMALVSSLWATAPVFDKMALSLMPPSQHAFIQCCAIASVLASWLKIQQSPLAIEQVRKNARWLFVAVAFAVTALLTQFIATQKVQMGIFEALKRSCGLLSALVLGWLVFGEKITAVKFLLVAVMGFGIFILLT